MLEELEQMKLRCKVTPTAESGLHFTEGKIYDCTKVGDDDYLVRNDNGDNEAFWDINLIFNVCE